MGCEGDTVEVGVESQWLPPKCSKCNSFGHGSESSGKDITQTQNVEEHTKSQGVDKEWMQVNKGKNKVFPELVIEERGEALGFPAVLVRVQLVTRERVALSFS